MIFFNIQKNSEISFKRHNRILSYSKKFFIKNHKLGTNTIFGTISLVLSIFIAVFGWKNFLNNTNAIEERDFEKNNSSLNLEIQSASESIYTQSLNQMKISFLEQSNSVLEENLEQPKDLSKKNSQNIQEVVLQPKKVVKPEVKYTKPKEESNINNSQNNTQENINLPPTNDSNSSETIVEEPSEEGSVPEEQEDVQNLPPVISSSPSSSSVYFGDSFIYQISASDPDLNELTYNISSSEFDVFSDSRVDSSLFMSIARIFKFTPQASDIGQTFNFLLSVSDGSLTANQNFSLSVLDPGVKIELDHPISGQVVLTGETIEMRAEATYVGVPVDWLEDQFVWFVKNETTGSSFAMFGRNVSASFLEAGDYTITITAEDPEDSSKSYSKSVSIVVQ